MRKTFDGDLIKWRPRRYWKRSDKPFRGLDTETCHGDIGMIADPHRSISTVPGPIEVHRILSFLHDPTVYGVWWNLRYDAECLLKLLPRDVVVSILSGEETAFDTGGDEWSIRYVPGKFFKLGKKGARSSQHFDMAQFYQSSLDDAAKRHLGVGKTPMDTKLLGSSWNAWSDVERVRRYCKRDALLTQRLAELWKTYAVGLGVDYSFPASPAFVAGEHALQQGWPSYSVHQHDTVGKVALASYFGGRFEARCKGWGEYHHADIRSAYPSVMVELPDPSVQWSMERNEGRALQQPWGFVYTDLHVDKNADWSPIVHRNRDDVLFSPVGNLGRKWVTLDEYRALRTCPQASTSFVKAYTAPDTGERPLSWVRDIYDQRTKLKSDNDPRQLVLKVLMNSIYGKSLERVPIRSEIEWRLASSTDRWDDIVLLDGEPMVAHAKRFIMGKLFNPMWAAHITARVRLALWKVIQDIDVALVATDGILSNERLPPELFGDRLGEWEDGGVKPGVIVGNGLYQLEGERPKRRGFGAPSKTWEWIDTLRRLHPKATGVTVEYERPIHPGEALVRSDLKLSDVGAFVTDARSFDLNDDRKRSFPRVTAGKLLREQVTGVPLLVNGQRAR